MPKGYIMGMVTVTNPEGYKPYMQQTGELVAEYGGSYLVRGGNKTVVEGDLCLGPLKLCQYLLTNGVAKNGTETVFG